MRNRNTGKSVTWETANSFQSAAARRNRSSFLVFSFVFIVLMVFGMARVSHAQGQPGAALGTVAGQLASQSGVPVLLPPQMQLTDYSGKPFRYYAVVEDAGPRGYAIRIQDTPDCDYQACLVGYITATKSGVPPKGAESVALANGVRGVYNPMQLKVAAEVAFWRDGVTYHFRLGTSNQQKARLLQIVNNALQNGPARPVQARLLTASAH